MGELNRNRSMSMDVMMNPKDKILNWNGEMSEEILSQTSQMFVGMALVRHLGF